jgi:CO/xanthine dehydrogenase FAD-binding subunit
LVREYVLATSAEQAATLIAEDPSAIVMGGGTTIMPRVPLAEVGAERVIGLAAAQLDYVHSSDATALGAMTPLKVVGDLQGLPILARAARSIGGWALRSTATVGGNLLVAPPYGDLAPPLLALDAELVIQGVGGRRSIGLAEALAGDRLIGESEIIAEIVVPVPSGAAAYERLARRAANSPAVVAVAARVRRDGGTVAEARLALGAVGPRAFRATAAEEMLTGSSGDAAAIAQAVEAVVAACEPADDPVASAWYRRRMAALLARRALESVLGEETR